MANMWVKVRTHWRSVTETDDERSTALPESITHATHQRLDKPQGAARCPQRAREAMRAGGGLLGTSEGGGSPHKTN